MITRQPLGAEVGRVYLKANALILIAPDRDGVYIGLRAISRELGPARQFLGQDFANLAMKQLPGSTEHHRKRQSA